MKRAVPSPLSGESATLAQVDTGLWSLERTLVHFGFARLPARTTIVRVEGGGVVVVSPPPALDAEAEKALAAIGRVTQVVVPNSFHYVFAAPFLAAHPGASLLIPPALAARVPSFPTSSELGASAEAALPAGLEAVVLGPVRGLAELLLFHRPSASLILTDAAFHMRRFPRTIDRLFWRFSGIPSGFAPGRTSKNLLLGDHAIAHRALSSALEWPFERIVPAHGELIEDDARAHFEKAFAAYL